jgi:hypothetical protein
MKKFGAAVHKIRFGLKIPESFFELRSGCTRNTNMVSRIGRLINSVEKETHNSKAPCIKKKLLTKGFPERLEVIQNRDRAKLLITFLPKKKAKG